MKTGLALICFLGVWSGAVGQCQKDYVAVGEKCYSVPGLASGFNFWTSSEVCSYQKGHLFHVEDISEWHQLNTFLVETLRKTNTYWTGISAQGHPGLWGVRSSGYELNADAVEFKSGAPSNSDDKLCLAVEYQKHLHRYQFVDYPCSNQYAVVCQAKDFCA